jgi:hypothetical protein
MQVYQTDHEGFFIGVSRADPDPLAPSNWLIPGGCVAVEPPVLSEGQRAQWSGDSWVIVDPVPEPTPEPVPEPTLEEINARIEAKRQSAYTAEADPLFFKWQAGEATEAEWLAKREEIRARFPY